MTINAATTTPSPVPEAELLRVIKHITTILSKKFSFGPHTEEDIGQEIAVMCLDALSRYNPEVGPFENYAFRHCKLRLINKKRDELKRCDAPCRKCNEGLPHEATKECKQHEKWAKRQRAKAGLCKGAPTPSPFYDLPTEATDVEDDAATREMLRMIDAGLNADLRRDYLLLRARQPIPKERRLAVVEAVKSILGDGLGDVDPDGLRHPGGR
jgi:hypothetical protein